MKAIQIKRPGTRIILGKQMEHKMEITALIDRVDEYAFEALLIEHNPAAGEKQHQVLITGKAKTRLPIAGVDVYVTSGPIGVPRSIEFECPPGIRVNQLMCAEDFPWLQKGASH